MIRLGLCEEVTDPSEIATPPAPAFPRDDLAKIRHAIDCRGHNLHSRRLEKMTSKETRTTRETFDGPNRREDRGHAAATTETLRHAKRPDRAPRQPVAIVVAESRRQTLRAPTRPRIFTHGATGTAMGRVASAEEIKATIVEPVAKCAPLWLAFGLSSTRAPLVRQVRGEKSRTLVKPVAIRGPDPCRALRVDPGEGYRLR
eukprot:g13168.t1